MKQFILLIFSSCILALSLTACEETAPLPPKNVDSMVECTNDIKSCEDGSTVRRDPLNDCEFDKCLETPSN